MILLDGNALSKTIKTEIRQLTTDLISNGQRPPHLAAVLVGNHPASRSYVTNKVRSCAEVGFHSTLIEKEDTITQSELIDIVQQLNNDQSIDGFIVQLPLPGHIDEMAVTMAIHPSKDVDGFHPGNMGRMVLGLPCFLPATPKGILTMLERYDIDIRGKICCVIGRSNIVGTPMSILLSRKSKPGDATVILCHSRTKNIKEMTLQADVIVAAIGQAHFLKRDMVKEGAVIIDVGMNRIEDPGKKSGFRLVGDVDFENVAPIASAITPVPGGVGPMTVLSLIQNTLKARFKEVV